MFRRFLAVTLAILASGGVAFGQSQEPPNPYRAEGDAREHARLASLEELRAIAAALARTSRRPVEHCTVAELYTMLGDGRAAEYYEKAITGDPREPAFELLYGDYLRLYRGAGQRPLFPAAERHLHAARAKLAERQAGRAQQRPWDPDTAARLTRSLTALYERDGFQLATRTPHDGHSVAATAQPWLFFGSSARFAESLADLDRSSDIRDLASSAQFSASPARLNRPLTAAELRGLARTITAQEIGGTLRVRSGSTPVIDVSLSGRRSGEAQVTNFYRPDRFNDLRLNDVGVSVEKPFTVGRSLDALAGFQLHRVERRGLIEFLPDSSEHVTQLAGSGSLSHYVGPDRTGISATYVRQNIHPSVDGMAHRDRTLAGGMAIYQIFRPLFGRHVDTGLARHFEPRGIELFGGMLHDRERYPTSPADVFITRRDYFAGVTARGLGRFDVTLQPTWYESRVSRDAAQSNRQFRLAGTIVARILDEERTAGIPSERLARLPIAFVQLVIPYHWDHAVEGVDAFRSRGAGAELWIKFFTDGSIGVTTLAVIGYSRQQFPSLAKDFNLVSARIGVGF